MGHSSEDRRRSWWRKRIDAPAAPVTAPRDPIGDSIPVGIRIASAWSWRILLIAALIALIGFLVVQLRLIVIPVLVSMLIAALLLPLVDLLHRNRWPRWLAILAALVGLIVVIVGLVYLAASQISGQFDGLRQQSMTAYENFRTWLVEGPFQMTERQLDGYLADAGRAIQQDSQVILSGAFRFGTTLGHIVAGALIALFSTLFILIDGKGIWAWIVSVFPRRARPAVDGAGTAGWHTLRNFVRVQILVATIDAIGIGVGAFVLNVPLAIPIAILVFLGSFIPIVGAIVTGVLAVFVALVYNGWLVALILLAVVLLVHEVEGHVLQPLIMGTAVRIHPLAVVLVVATGTMLAGIPGALFSVPLTAVLNVIVKYVSSGVWRSEPRPGLAPVQSDIWRTEPRPRRTYRRMPRRA